MKWRKRKKKDRVGQCIKLFNLKSTTAYKNDFESYTYIKIEILQRKIVCFLLLFFISNPSQYRERFGGYLLNLGEDEREREGLQKIY